MIVEPALSRVEKKCKMKTVLAEGKKSLSSDDADSRSRDI